ncbi:MAG TPA: glycosyltransferase family 39 protein [Nitriliruptorales bacterium]
MARLRLLLGDDRVVAVVLFLTFLAVRLPLRSTFLVNWDAVNFALGVDRFDLAHHQPHPPGYIGYVLLGRLVAAVVGDPNAALTLISVVAGALTPALYLLLARRMLPRRYAVLTALLLGSSPLLWYYSLVALTYVVAGAIIVGLALAAHRAHRDRSVRSLFVACLLIVVLGAVRQTDAVLLLPLWWYGARAFDCRVRWCAASAVVFGTLVWLTPLVWLSGGPTAYVRESLALATFAGGRTWAPGGDLAGLLQNVGLVAAGGLFGLGAALFAVLGAVRYRVRPFRALEHDDRALVVRWLVPALIVYLSLHTGQLGYMLVVLPALFVVAGAAMTQIEDAWRERRRTGWSRTLRVPRLASGWVGAGAFVAVNTVTFFLLPSASTTLFQPSARAASGLGPASSSVFVPSPADALERTRQYNLPANDEHWGAIEDLMQRFDPSKAQVLALPASGGSFRHLNFYAPGHAVHGIGEDRRGGFGHLLTARDGARYDLDGLDQASRTLWVAPSVELLLVPDRALQDLLDPELHTSIVRDGDVSMTVVRRPPGTSLVFEGDDRSTWRITLRPVPQPDGRIIAASPARADADIATVAARRRCAWGADRAEGSRHGLGPPAH